ncbi:hypothetical protein STEG23_021512 [Scotinomys teguina]
MDREAREAFGPHLQGECQEAVYCTKGHEGESRGVPGTDWVTGDSKRCLTEDPLTFPEAHFNVDLRSTNARVKDSDGSVSS